MIFTCAMCQKEFHSRFKTSKYCSHVCQIASMRREYRFVCLTCHKPGVSNQKRKYCSQKCSQIAHSGAGNPKFHGGFIDEKGYRVICVNGKRKLEHRHFMEQKLGRSLKSNEIVHHKDENKLNNSLDNLELLSGSAEHCLVHATFRSATHKQCTRCKEILPRSEFGRASVRKPTHDPNNSRCRSCLRKVDAEKRQRLR